MNLTMMTNLRMRNQCLVTSVKINRI